MHTVIIDPAGNESYYFLMVGGTPCRHCRAGIQNGSRDPGRPRAFLNELFRLLNAKIGKKTNNFLLCCQLRLRTATEWVSYVSYAMVTLASAVPYLFARLLSRRLTWSIIRDKKGWTQRVGLANILLSKGRVVNMLLDV